MRVNRWLLRLGQQEATGTYRHCGRLAILPGFAKFTPAAAVIGWQESKKMIFFEVEMPLIGVLVA